MEAINFMDFGRKNRNCYTSEGFVLWEITGNESGIPVFLKGDGTNMIVHVLVLAGEIKMGREDRLYLLTKNCFANFIDCSSLVIQDISEDARAYVMLFTAPFITSLLKNTPPFPPSYVLKVKVWPVSVMFSGTIETLLKRVESMVEILGQYPSFPGRNVKVYAVDVHDGHGKRAYPAGNRERRVCGDRP